MFDKDDSLGMYVSMSALMNICFRVPSDILGTVSHYVVYDNSMFNDLS